MNTWKLLLVEDDMALQALLALELHRQGMSYDRVTSAEDALMMLASTNYTGLIVDLTLPDMDGWTFIETLHRDPRTATLPCVAITCYHATGVESTALEAGFIAYIRKPLDIQAFVGQLPAILSGDWALPPVSGR